MGSKLLTARLSARLEILGASLFTLWIIWPLVGPLIGREAWVTGFDTVAYSGPNLQVTLEGMRAGRLSGWNDAIYGGVPHLGNMHAAAFYPLKWPAAWSGMGVHRAWLLLVALHVCLLGAGMFWLARRRLGLAPPAAGLACVVVVGSGAVMIRMLFFEQIMVLAWAPWLLGTIDATLSAHGAGHRASRARSVAALSLVTALTLTAGHVQVVYLLTMVAGVWAVARTWDLGAVRQLGVAVRLRGLVWVGLAGGLGTMLAAPQLLPSLELARRSANRGDRSLATVSNPGYSVQIRRLPGTWFGDPLARVHSVTTAGYENLTYVGVVAATLAVVGLVVLWQRRQRATALAAGVSVAASVVLAIGPRLMPYRVAFRLVPGFSAARVPARWALVAVLVMALLAAVGLDGLRRRELGSRARRLIVVSMVTVALAVAVLPFDKPPGATLMVWAALAALVAGAVLAGRDPSGPAEHDAERPHGHGDGDRDDAGERKASDSTSGGKRERDGESTSGAGRRGRSRVPMVGVGVWLVLACWLGAVTELGLAARHSAARSSRAPRPYTEVADRPLHTWLQQQPGRVFALTSDQVDSLDQVTIGLRPNANVTAGVRSVDGYDGGIQVTEAWVNAWQPLTQGPVDPESPIRSQLALPLDPEAFADLGIRWVLIDPVAFDPAVALPGWARRRVDDGLAVFENPRYRGEAWWAPPLPTTEDQREPWPLVSHTRPGVLNVDLQPAITGSAPATIARGIEPNEPTAARLVIAEQWDPGWTARADGRAVEVQRSGPLFLGLDLPAGTRQVELRYRTPGLRLGLVLALMALMSLVALVAQAAGPRVLHPRR